MAAEALTKDTIQVVLCRLADAKYALEIEYVQEIVRRTQLTRVPKTKPWMGGVINLRGTVMPTLNLHKKFNIDEEPVTDDARIIIVKSNNHSYGIMVDEVSEVVRIQSATVENNPSENQEDKAYIKGLIRNHGELYILLNPQIMLKFFR